LGIFGEKYGYGNTEGISPTEREHDLATELYKMRLIYVKKQVSAMKRKRFGFAKRKKKLCVNHFTTPMN
jgi:hypothetical protein